MTGWALWATIAWGGGCEEALPGATDRYEAWRCFYMEARKSGGWEAAETRLSEGVTAGDPWAGVSLGHVYSDQGDPRAEAAYRASLEAFVAAEERGGAAQARFGLANYLWHRGAGPEAPRSLLDEALADALADGRPALVATARAQLARHLWRTSEDHGLAYELARDAEAVAFPDGSYQLRVLVLHVLAGVCGETGRMDEAVSAKARLVALAAEAGDAYVEATARLNLADAWLEAPWLAPAGEVVREAYRAEEAARRANNPYALAGARCVLARAGGPHAPDAEANWSACADGYGVLGEHSSALYGRMGLAVVRAQRDPDGAEAILASAIADADALGQVARGLDLRFVLAEIAWGRGDAERGRERSEQLLAWFRGLSDAQRTEIERAGFGNGGAIAVDALAAHLLDLGDQEGALATLEAARARRFVPAGGPPPRATEAPLSIDALRAALAPHEAVVVYQMAERQTLFPAYQAGSWALIVSAAGEQVVPLDPPDGLDGRARLFEGLVARRDGGHRAAGAALDEALVAPVRRALPPGVAQVSIVPDGVLHRLSWRALGSGPEALSVSIVPSLAVWRALRERSAAEGASGALVIADPALPRARFEGASVADLLGGDLLEGAAPADVLGRDLSGYRLLHFAVHATVDGRAPERSMLSLPGGSLAVSDLEDARLSGQVVVLSSCSGAGGRAVEGEGVVGLARTFLRRGARVVVGSLWPIRDDEAEQVFGRVAEGLAAGKTVGDAVRDAQAAAAAAGLPEAAWAGIVVVGDGRARPFPAGRRQGWAAPALLLASLTAFAGLMRARSAAR